MGRMATFAIAILFTLVISFRFLSTTLSVFKLTTRYQLVLYSVPPLIYFVDRFPLQLHQSVQRFPIFCFQFMPLVTRLTYCSAPTLIRVHQFWIKVPTANQKFSCEHASFL